jgi:hypothetical protein
MADNDSDEINDEIERLLANKDVKNTKKATSQAYKIFAKSVDVAQAEADNTSLDKALAKFYATAKKEDSSNF